MTRIIQRCFLVLAFTGILLSTAQETAVSEVSDSRSHSRDTPTSAPENNFNTAETSSSSFYSSSDKKDDDKSASTTEAAAAKSSSQSEVAAVDVGQTSSKVPVTTFKGSDADGLLQCLNCSFPAVSESTAHDENVSLSASQSDLLKNELKDDASVTEALIMHSDSSDSSGKISSSAGTEEKKQSNEVNETTTEAAVKQPDYATSPGYVSTYSGQSSVPSEEEIVYNSSYVDKNQSSEGMSSSAPSKVQSEDSENKDVKSSTHKRSLNATNAIVNSTTDMSFAEASTITPGSTSLSHDSVLSKLTEREYSTAVPSAQVAISQSDANHAAIINDETKGTIHDVLKTKVSSSTASIGNDNSNGEDSDDVIILFSNGPNPKLGSRIMVPESLSFAGFKNASPTPVSLDALSMLKEESIQPSESFDRTAQIENMRYTSARPPIPVKWGDLEVEYDSPFDPDGMTHNFTQDPDSVTFSLKVVHGKPTGSYQSDLEHEEMHSNKPELRPDNLSTSYTAEVVGSSSQNMEGSHSSEREREVPSSGHGLSPHDEPDREAPTSLHTFESTKSPERTHSTSEPKTVKKNEASLSIDNESEEMLNDSPHFTQNQNKPTGIPIAGITDNYLNKDLENNISNDITHTSDLKTQNLQNSNHELDFPIEYQTQQSEIRPVTAMSPINNSETVTDFPIPHNIQSHSSSNETISIPNDTLSPIILPNPAPTIVNKSSEKITVNISPEMLPKDYIPPDLVPKDYVPPELLPKDYVTPKSLSTDHVPSKMPPKEYIPSEMLPKDYVTPEKQKEPVKPEILPKDYISPELLPKDYVPTELLPKDYVPSEKTPQDTLKPDMPPKDYVSPELLPKDYMPPHLLPKDYVTPEILPKDYTSDQFELVNNTDTIINTTIAGVAVKTSVSVSLPLSKSPNSTAGTFENSANAHAKMASITSNITPISVSVNKDTDGNLSSGIPTEIPTESTTEAKGFRIRKPKVRPNSGDGDAPVSARTRKPFLPSLQKPSSTAGPPVSIFRQPRTRIASITSSTTQRPIPQYSTIKVHYASRIPGMVPGGEMVFSIEPVTTTVATTTETEEPFSEEPFKGQTVGPVVPTEDNVTLLKVAGMIVVDKGLRWNEQLNNRLSPQYKEREKFVQNQLYRLFRTSIIAPQLWKIQIDGFSGKRNSRSVVIDFFLYLIKSQNEITPVQLVTVFHDKLINNTFSRFTVDTNKTTFEFLNEELMRTTTPPPEEEEHEPVIPQWAIAVIVVGAASLIFIVLFAAVAILGRHHVRRRYSNKLNDEDSDRPSDWESKMAAAYENLAADTIYDAEDFHSDTYKKRYPNSTYHGRPSRPRRADSWSSSDWSPPPRRPRPQVHRIVY